jgi:hypothetical protein
MIAPKAATKDEPVHYSVSSIATPARGKPALSCITHGG